MRIFPESPVECHNLIFDLKLWTAYTSVSLILEELFSRFSFYDIACFSILASGPLLDVTMISENILRSSSIVTHLYGYISCFRGLFQSVQDSTYNLTFKLFFIVFFFRMVHNKELFRRSSVKDNHREKKTP